MKSIKKKIFLLAVTLFLSVNSGFAQINPVTDCLKLEENLTDAAKFKKAVECRAVISNEETPLETSTLPPTVRVVTLVSSCNKFKLRNINWVTVLDQLTAFYRTHGAEFQNDALSLENRLEKLIGVEAGSYKCFVVYDVSRDLLRKTVKDDDDGQHPFTNKGFTCDWFYKNIGCSYGVSEFIVKTNGKNETKNNYRKKIERVKFKNAERIYQYLKGEIK